MEISKKNLNYLELLQDIYEISTLSGTKTYIWGGLTIDIFEEKFLREHGDLDGFIANMVSKLAELTKLYQQKGYQTEYVNDIGMFKVKKGDVHASFNSVEFKDDCAIWKHIGDDGAVYFPTNWLDQVPRKFYSALVYTSGIKFEYVIKNNVGMLNPECRLREKDCAALEYLENAIEKHNLSKEDFLKEVWSFNPYWIKRGYKEFMRPTVAWKLEPK